MNSQMLSSLNEHMIDIKLIKEKKYERTCVSGLHNFMSQSDIVILTSFIQKKLGSNLYKNVKNDNCVEFIFSGNHVNKITSFLLIKTNISKDLIRV